MNKIILRVCSLLAGGQCLAEKLSDLFRGRPQMSTHAANSQSNVGTTGVCRNFGQSGPPRSSFVPSFGGATQTPNSPVVRPAVDRSTGRLSHLDDAFFEEHLPRSREVDRTTSASGGFVAGFPLIFRCSPTTDLIPLDSVWFAVLKRWSRSGTAPSENSFL